MPSLLEALEKKYYADCQFDNDNNTTTTTIATNNGRGKSSSSNNGSGQHHHHRHQHGCNSYDIALDDTMPASDSRLISVFIPRISPLKLVPELLVLNDCDIDCAGDFETIKEKCQRVRELDLAQNKLSDWKEVFDILQHMPRIEFLNLSKNQLMGPIADYYAPASISNLRSIVLNGTYLDWQCVDMLLEQLPILEELHLSLNDYREVLLDATTTNTTATNNTTTTTTTTKDQTNTTTTMTTEQKVNTTNANNEEKAEEEEVAVERTTTSANSNQNTTTTTNTNITPPLPSTDCAFSDTTSEASSSDAETNTSPRTTKCLKRITPHRALKTLHFTGNPIENWAEICRLGRVFPGLQNLVLAQCPIKTLKATDDDDNSTTQTQHQHQNQDSDAHTADINTTQKNCIDEGGDDCPYRHFENLRFLNLSCANINTWDDIDRIARFPNLHHVRVKNWPLWERLECTEHERRQLLIARLPNVSLLNGGGVISADEREDAERAFIRHYMDKPKWERPKRYDELVVKHGKLDPLVNINLKPDKRVKILLTYNERTEARLVDIYCTVADLKVRLEKYVNLPPNKMRLYYVDQDFKEFGAPELMKYPNKLLYSYNIQPGDEIIIDEKK